MTEAFPDPLGLIRRVLEPQQMSDSGSLVDAGGDDEREGLTLRRERLFFACSPQQSFTQMFVACYFLHMYAFWRPN